MSTPAFLWLLLVMNAILYVVVGRMLIGQPTWNRPEVFRNPVVAAIFGAAPMIGFLLLIVAGFRFHTSPWWFLAANVAVFVAFSVKPGGGM